MSIISGSIACEPYNTRKFCQQGFCNQRNVLLAGMSGISEVPADVQELYDKGIIFEIKGIFLLFLSTLSQLLLVLIKGTVFLHKRWYDLLCSFLCSSFITCGFPLFGSLNPKNIKKHVRCYSFFSCCYS